MAQHIGEIALLVRDYEEATAWFTQKLGFALVADVPIPPAERWMTVAPPGSQAAVRLARAETERQKKQIGHQSDERVLLYLHTDDFERDHAAYAACGVRFVEAPRQERYGGGGGVRGSARQSLGSDSAQGGYTYITISLYLH